MRAYGQKDPLLEYKAEAFRMFELLMTRVCEDTLQMLMRVQLQGEAPPPPQPATASPISRARKRARERRGGLPPRRASSLSFGVRIGASTGIKILPGAWREAGSR